MERLSRLAGIGLVSAVLALSAAGAATADPGAATGPAQPAATQQEMTPARTVDVLVFYTPDVRDARGGTAQTEATVRTAVSTMNAALTRSKVDGAVRLAHVAEISGVPSGTASERLRWLSTDGGVAAARNQHRADLVSVIVPGSGGLAQVPGNVAPSDKTANSAFSVLGNDWLLPTGGGAGVLAHELGHNLGLSHDWATSPNTNPIYPYNKGFVTASGTIDIMAYTSACPSTCQRVPYYSNPSIVIKGERLGRAGGDQPADAVRTLNQTVPLISSYR
ncbi:MAG: zinc-dependent metalloprotease [Propionibacteriales bacterium]|nr:zinc-dependent metalloprotease [Propionibacteriales bacterium]